MKKVSAQLGAKACKESQVGDRTKGLALDVVRRLVKDGVLSLEMLGSIDIKQFVAALRQRVEEVKKRRE